MVAYRQHISATGYDSLDPRNAHADYTQVERYIKIEKLRRQLEAQERFRLIAERYMDFRSFIRESFKILEPRNEYVHNWHIDAIADHLMAVTKGDIQNLIINIPPRHMKSLTTSVAWPAWAWTLKPETQFIYSSYSSSLAIRDSIKTRRLINSDWYQEHWGEVYQLRDDQNQKIRFENTEGGYRIATSVLGAATGEGGNIVVVDDPHNMKEIFSEYKRNEAISWWDTVMSTRVNQPKVDHKVIISQRGHEVDLVGHLLTKMKQRMEHDPETDEEMGEIDHYETLILPAEYVPRYIEVNGHKIKPKTSIGFSDPREKDGELLYPQRFPSGVVKALKSSLGTYAFSAQLQQSPTPAGGAIFSVAHLRCWVPVHMLHQYSTAEIKDVNGRIHKVEVRPLPDGNYVTDFLSCDFSFSDFSTSSYIAIQVWRYIRPNFYLLHQLKAQKDFKDTMTSLGKIITRYPGAEKKLMELKANGYAIYSSLRDKISGIVPITPRESKVARAQAISPLVEAGNLIIPHPMLAPWSQDYVYDLISFPFGASDDAVDATTQGMNHYAFGPQITIS